MNQESLWQIKAQALEDAKEQNLCCREGVTKHRYLDPRVQSLYESHLCAYLQELRGDCLMCKSNKN